MLRDPEKLDAFLDTIDKHGVNALIALVSNCRRSQR
jgi:hypothetical protein